MTGSLSRRLTRKLSKVMVCPASEISGIGKKKFPALLIFDKETTLVPPSSILKQKKYAHSIFNTALFIYAHEGKVPGFYSREELSHAFLKKK